MNNFQPNPTAIPEDQIRIRAKCYHPSGAFEEFQKESIEQLIPERFEQQVQKYPHRVAVKTRTQKLTYSELNQIANRVARCLLAQSDKREEPIVLLLEQGASAISAIMGVLKSGKIYVPLDPLLPQGRIEYILKDSQATLIVTNIRNFPLAIKLAGNKLPILNLDTLDAYLYSDNLDLSILPDALAYIIYTSGSTGQPKGVMKNHRNLLHDSIVCINDFNICKHDRLALLHSFCFYASVKRIFPALLSGGSLFILNAKKEGVSDLVSWLIQNEITISGVKLLLRERVDNLTDDNQFPNL